MIRNSQLPGIKVLEQSLYVHVDEFASKYTEFTKVEALKTINFSTFFVRLDHFWEFHPSHLKQNSSILT